MPLARNTVNWEFFITGKLTNDPLPPITLKHRLIAIFRTINSLYIFRLKGWYKACKYIESIKSQEGFPTLSKEQAVRLAYQEVIWSMIIVRILDPEVLCLTRSIALTSYLRSLHLPAQIVVGRSVLLNDPVFDFHAWTELYSDVINDYEAVKRGYKVLYRFPKT